MRQFFLVPALALGLSAPAAAQMPENYVIDTAADLVAICGVDASHADYVAAIHFCHGYGHGAIQYHLIAAEAMPERSFFCIPDPAPTRAEAWADFLSWMDANPAYLEVEALNAMFQYLAVTYPCS